MKLSPSSQVPPLDASRFAFAIVAARFNDSITQRLVEGACEALAAHGAPPDAIRVEWVPGAFELPLLCQKLAQSGRYDAVIALGCVIRGETPHFEYVAGEAARGIMQAALATGVPITFGVITADTPQQATDRAGGRAGNKGAEAALAAIEMAQRLGAVRAESGSHRRSQA